MALTRRSKTGHLNKWVAPTLAIALGLADTFFTEAHYKLYGLDAMSPPRRGKTMLDLFEQQRQNNAR